MSFWTKEELYKNVDDLIEQLDFTKESYPLNSINIAKKYCINLNIKLLDLDRICGILIRGSNFTSIALNANHSNEMKNFDCMHELIHYFLHEKEVVFECICSESKLIQQKSDLEWQANEGAAQALVPYQIFIPMYVSLYIENPRYTYKEDIIMKLSKYFFVSEAVIKNRIKNLQYEIYQYFVLQKPADKLKILSKNKLSQYKLDKYKAEKVYCYHCLSCIGNYVDYCNICGNKLKEPNTYLEGLGYMIYDEILLNSEGKAIICPVCDNEDTNVMGNYCKICGTCIVNLCTFENCGNILDGNSRYCPDCGAESRFLINGILRAYNSYDPSEDLDPDNLPF